jgi:FkbM family methyltransferase
MGGGKVNNSRALRVLPALNFFFRHSLPGAHAHIRRVLRWWLIESRATLEACPAVPRKVAGEWLYMHPRFLAEPLDVEAHVLARFRQLIRPGATVLDVGGYIGLHALYAAKLAGRLGRVFSFEPSPSNFRYLSYHCGKNTPQPEALPLLISDRTTARVPFHMLNEGDSSSNSMTFRELGEGRHLDVETRIIEVKSTTLDAFCAARRLWPDFIKIDVEGAELHVLRGASRLLRECRPEVILALHPAWLPTGTSPRDLRDFLISLGYTWLDLDGREAEECELREYYCRPPA